MLPLRPRTGLGNPSAAASRRRMREEGLNGALRALNIGPAANTAPKPIRGTAVNLRWCLERQAREAFPQVTLAV